MVKNVRKMTRAVWLGVARTEGKDRASQGIVERRSALNLSLAFVIAVKHYLRQGPLNSVQVYSIRPIEVGNCCVVLDAGMSMGMTTVT